MRILMISSDFVPNTGGVATHVHGLSRTLAQYGYSVAVLNARWDGLGKQGIEVIDGIRVYRYSVTRQRQWLFKPVIGFAVLLCYGFLVSRILRMVLAQESSEVIHWHDVLDGGLALRFCTSCNTQRLVVTNHTSGFLKSLDSRRLRMTLKWGLGMADVVIGPSRELAEKSLFLDKPVFYIPNGVDPDYFAPSPPEVKQAAKKDVLLEYFGEYEENQRLVVCPRRIVPKNGVVYFAESIRYALEALGSIPARFLVVGGGSTTEEQKLLLVAQHSGTERYLRITGNQPHAKMIHFYQAADIVVIPSLVEAVSIAALEAAACALPVIATSVGGLPDLIVDGQTGRLVPPASAQSLGLAIADLLDTPHEANRLGQAARERVLKYFAWGAVVKRTLEVYETDLNMFPPGKVVDYFYP